MSLQIGSLIYAIESVEEYNFEDIIITIDGSLKDNKRVLEMLGKIKITKVNVDKVNVDAKVNVDNDRHLFLINDELFDVITDEYFKKCMQLLYNFLTDGEAVYSIDNALTLWENINVFKLDKEKKSIFWESIKINFNAKDFEDNNQLIELSVGNYKYYYLKDQYIYLCMTLTHSFMTNLKDQKLIIEGKIEVLNRSIFGCGSIIDYKLLIDNWAAIQKIDENLEIDPKNLQAAKVYVDGLVNDIKKLIDDIKPNNQPSK